MRWSESVTLEFVKIYLRHECLWNPNHHGYKMRNEREKAYRSIGEGFKDSTGKCLSIPEVRLKIKNLRSTYMQQVQKILQRSSPDEIYEPSLVWFHEMDRCLKDIPSQRPSIPFNSSQETPEIDSSCQTWEDQILSNSMDEPNPDPLTPQSDEYDSTRTEHSPKLKRHTATWYHKKNKKKKLKHRLSSKLSDQQSAIEDEFDIYGKFIASQLRKMDLRRALRLQLDIQNLVSEARISDND